MNYQLSAIIFLMLWASMSFGYFKKQQMVESTFKSYLDAVCVGLVLAAVIAGLLLVFALLVLAALGQL